MDQELINMFQAMLEQIVRESGFAELTVPFALKICKKNSRS